MGYGITVDPDKLSRTAGDAADGVGDAVDSVGDGIGSVKDSVTNRF
ncbi:hypothetical protein [Streptomyces sp. NPDC088358]